MKKTKLTALFLASLLGVQIFTSCASTNTDINDDTTKTSIVDTVISGTDSTAANLASSTVTTSVTSQSTASGDVTYFKKTDYYIEWKSGSYKSIDLSQGSATITQSGTYVLTGTLTNGSITVNVDKTVDTEPVYLILNNASINSEDATPINIIEAKKVVLVLEPGTVNTVTQGSITTTDENFPSAAIFSKANLTITGSGTLNVTTKYNDGITSKDDLKITDGTINVNAAQDGIVGKDLLAIEKANITVTAGKDGMRSTNSTDEGEGNIVILSGKFVITAANDGIQAEKALLIESGSFDITTGGGYPGQSTKTNKKQMGRGFGVSTGTSTTTEDESRKGIKAGTEFTINGGTFTLSTYDDGLHSKGYLIINGGTFEIQAGAEGIQGNDIVINECLINILHSYEGIEGIATLTVNAGIITITASDDGINISNTTGLLTLNGGEITISAGADGIDVNGSINQTGGKAIILTPTSGNGGDGPLDYDGTFTRTGGSIVDKNGNDISTAKLDMGGGNKGMGGMGGKGKPGR